MNKRLLIGNLGFAAIALFFLCFFIYQFYFEKKIKSRFVVSEIVTMKIDSSKVDTIEFMNEIYYTFYCGGKYKVSINRELPESFKTFGEDDIYIRDISGKSVFYYNTRHDYNWNAWKSDYIKLFNYLKIKTL